tara:strand:+ start:845 stop:1195 length:351 start_codon:yes stop_codon:yes gene_type:complete
MKINKIIAAFGNMNQIMEGVKNKVFKKQDIEDIADIRWMQCVACPALDETGKHCAMPKTQPCCADCGCSLGLKLRALSSSCPKGKWQAITSAEGDRAIKEQITNSKVEKALNKKNK